MKKFLGKWFDAESAAALSVSLLGVLVVVLVGIATGTYWLQILWPVFWVWIVIGWIIIEKYNLPQPKTSTRHNEPMARWEWIWVLGILAPASAIMILFLVLYGIARKLIPVAFDWLSSPPE